ncbi:hypothetical protein SADUNF_Sadunf16G0279400 [Salix dunnii]|uniref:Uncharacterized protein n=1 Tax=Salix dunnii TaxID=1413687 RepID=A0A835JGT9_9ROSI|nr:hypothetical protein SADUNF_Sadunf16G0279400 [Salix dunnii]
MAAAGFRKDRPVLSFYEILASKMIIHSIKAEWDCLKRKNNTKQHLHLHPDLPRLWETINDKFRLPSTSISFLLRWGTFNKLIGAKCPNYPLRGYTSGGHK